jgi:hypothetical protein
VTVQVGELSLTATAAIRFPVVHKAHWGSTASFEADFAPGSIFVMSLALDALASEAFAGARSPDMGWSPLATLTGADTPYPGIVFTPDDVIAPWTLDFTLTGSQAGSFIFPYEFDGGSGSGSGPTPPPPDPTTGEFVTMTARVSLSGQRAVKVVADGLADYPSIDALADALAIVGVTTTAIGLDADGLVQTSGQMDEPSWSWSIGAPVFVDDAGVLTQTVPTGKWLLSIGVALLPTRIDICKSPVISTP